MEADSVDGEIPARSTDLKPGLERWLVLFIFALAILFRVVALRSDNYLRLDWSAALLTDEGFYAHNARNVALFGTARTDEFNNVLVSPILHVIQTIVFQLFGSGMLQARLISAVLSLVGLGAFWLGLRKAFGSKIAVVGLLFLALGHINALYNRMALMDTPAQAMACVAFLIFVWSTEREGIDKKRSTIGFVAVGLVLALTMITRNLTLFLLAAPIAGLYAKGDLRRQLGWFVGWAGAMLVCVLVWYLPNSAELGPMNHYYRVHQVQPHSLRHLLENIRHAFIGDFRGIMPYLFRHSPVVLTLAACGLATKFEMETGARSKRFLAAWFIAGWVMLSVISYSPSRYYVTVYPALCALAAVGLMNLVPVVARIRASKSKLLPVAFGGLIGFHAALSLVHFDGVLPQIETNVVLVLGAVIGVMIALLGLRRGDFHIAPKYAVICLGIWACVNIAWTVDWLSHLAYSQAEFSQELGRTLPAGSVLIGDVAPGITMENSFKAIHVQVGLVNDHDPIGKFAGSPRYIAILDGKWREKWWVAHYPELITPENQIALKRVLKWDIGIYRVDDNWKAKNGNKNAD
ncbi:MAG: glycosyltransferase family 39 protein [Chthonomonadales bacterium]